MLPRPSFEELGPGLPDWVFASGAANVTPDEQLDPEKSAETLANPRIRPWLLPLLVIVVVVFIAMALAPALLAYFSHHTRRAGIIP
jgi:hypothetical protein